MRAICSHYSKPNILYVTTRLHTSRATKNLRMWDTHICYYLPDLYTSNYCDRPGLLVLIICTSEASGSRNRFHTHTHTLLKVPVIYVFFFLNHCSFSSYSSFIRFWSFSRFSLIRELIQRELKVFVFCSRCAAMVTSLAFQWANVRCIYIYFFFYLITNATGTVCAWKWYIGPLILAGSPPLHRHFVHE